jgi:hypothetical protein
MEAFPSTRELMRRAGEFVPTSQRLAISNQYGAGVDSALISRQIAAAGLRAEEVFGIAVDGNDRLDVSGGHPAFFEADHSTRKQQFESYLCDLYNLVCTL